MINDELLKILCCPDSKQSLKISDSKLLEKINQGIASKLIKNRGGNIVEKETQLLLVREDNKYAYPVQNDIPIMLIDEAIPLD